MAREYPKAAHAWQAATHVPTRSFVCGFCSHHVASDRGFSAQYQRDMPIVGNVCSFCGLITIFLGIGSGEQIPDARPGDALPNLPTGGVAELYDEARAALAPGAYSASVLACRTLLMHVAVEKGGTPGGSFASYVRELQAKGYIPPGGVEWIDRVRQAGNTATHEIVLMKRDEALEILRRVTALLRNVYEFAETKP